MIAHARYALIVASLAPSLSSACGDELPWIHVADDGSRFVRDDGSTFIPWGFNYDHDESESARLLEDYWEHEWPTVEADFAEMRELGANVVRVHLQTGRFLRAADEPDPTALAHLRRLIRLAERVGLYLDITGLGCYHKQDVPAWYDALDEAGRWAAQVTFWEAVAQVCATSPAVFCYDLMNEPVVPGGPNKRDDWLGPAFAGKHFVQFIALETRGRPRHAIARAWVDTLVAAIRRVDQRHMITVGLVPWSLDRAGLTSGFIPQHIAEPLDFISVHLYPERGGVDEALETLRGFDLGKPVLIEEMFPLKCGIDEFADFVRRSEAVADGWIGFYWGRTPDEYREGNTIRDAIMLQWLEFFQEQRPEAL